MFAATLPNVVAISHSVDQIWLFNGMNNTSLSTHV